MNGLGNIAPEEQGQPQAPQSSGASMFVPNAMLAQKNAQAEQDRAKAAIMQNMQQQASDQMVMQAAQEIASGTPPEALLQQGVPQKVVMAAVQMLQQGLGQLV